MTETTPKRRSSKERIFAALHLLADADMHSSVEHQFVIINGDPVETWDVAIGARRIENFDTAAQAAAHLEEAARWLAPEESQ